MIDDVFNDLIDDLERWRKRGDEETTEEEKLEDLKDVLDDYSKYIKDELRKEKPKIDVDKIIEEEKLSQF